MESSKDLRKLEVAWIALLELPVWNLNAYLLTGDFSSSTVDDVEKLHEIFNPALPQVVGVDPESS